MDPSEGLALSQRASTRAPTRPNAHAQVGKSGASWITQALLLCCGSINAAMPLTAATFGAVVTSFYFAVNGLRKEMAVRRSCLALLCTLSTYVSCGGPA